MANSALSRAAVCACVCLSLVAASAGLPSPQQPAKDSPPRASASPPETGWLDLRVSPVFDFYYFARKRAVAGAQQIDGLEGSAEILAALREMREEFGGWIEPLWGMVDGNLMLCQTVADAVREFSDVPETVNFRGKTYRARAPTLRLAKALQAAEPQFLKNIWPAHRATIEEAAARLARTLKPKEQDFLAFFARHLRTDAPRAPQPVLLVAEAQYPGAFTYFTRGGSVSVVSVKTFAGTLLEENVLHEAIHSLDGVNRAGRPSGGAGAGSVFAELRDRLRAAGVAERNVQDATHFVLFVTAAEAVRQIVDSAHRHYGDVEGVYIKLPRTAPVVALWRDYLTGKLSRERALELMIDKVPRAEPPKPQPTPTPTPPGAVQPTS